MRSAGGGEEVEASGGLGEGPVAAGVGRGLQTDGMLDAVGGAALGPAS